MRLCFNTCCENGKEVEYLDDNTRVVTDEDCHICHGTGEVEDYCYCAAFEPNECMCGAWDDVRDSWYDNEIREDFYEHEEQFYNEDFEEEE